MGQISAVGKTVRRFATRITIQLEQESAQWHTLHCRSAGSAHSPTAPCTVHNSNDNDNDSDEDNDNDNETKTETETDNDNNDDNIFA